MSEFHELAGMVRDILGNMTFKGESRVLLTTDFITRFTADPDPMNTHKKFSFEGHEWQRDMLNDVTREQATQKCSQIGVSEVFIRKALAMVVHYGLNVTYVMPTFEGIKSYVPARIDPVIRHSSKLSAMITSPDNNSHKMFKNGRSLYISHSNSEAARVSTALDMVVMDEFDRCDDANYDAWPQRLGHSKYKIYDCFSTPTISDYGINALFKQSDQKYYMIKCSACGEWQVMSFENNIMFKKGLVGLPDFNIKMPQRSGVDKLDWKDKYLDREPYIGCRKCRKKLDRNDTSLREWVPEFAGRKISGRQLTRFDVPWNPETRMGHNASTIIDVFFQNRSLLEFYNQVLGIPYDQSSDSITRSDLLKCQADPASGFNSLQKHSDGITFMGVDQGKNLHITIYRVNGVFFDLVYAEEMSMARGKDRQDFALPEVVSEISELARKFRVVHGVCDGAPDINLPRALSKAMPNVFCWAFFNTNTNGYNKPTEKNKVISINRSWVLNSVASMVKKAHPMFELRVPSNFIETKEGKEYESHFSAMSKALMEKPDKRTGVMKQETVWVKKSGRADHYLLSSCYALVATLFVYDPKDKKRVVPYSTGYTVVKTKGVL